MLNHTDGKKKVKWPRFEENEKVRRLLQKYALHFTKSYARTRRETRIDNGNSPSVLEPAIYRLEVYRLIH